MGERIAAGEGRWPTYAGELATADAAANCAPVKPEEEWSNERADEQHGDTRKRTEQTGGRERLRSGLATVERFTAGMAAGRGGKQQRGRLRWCEALPASSTDAQGRGGAVGEMERMEMERWRRI